MCVNDLIVQGAEPLFFLDYFASGKLDIEIATAVVAGIAAGCREAGCALIGGETAEMPGLYAAGDYDLAGFAVGAVERGEQLTGADVAPGDLLLGIASSGAHSNGYSLIRRIVARGGHDLAGPAPFDPSQSLGAALLTPTRIYVKALLPLIRAGQIKALAHITGGGFLENIPRVLPAASRAVVNAPALPPLFDWLRAEGGLAPEELARTFNCGTGMVVVVTPELAEAVIAGLAAAGETATVIGRIEAGTKGCDVSGSAGVWGAAAAWTASHDG